MPVTLLVLLAAAFLAQYPWTVTLRAQAPAAQATSALDYEFFKTKVQPIFLAKRDGHTRCAACHTKGTPMVLQKLSTGAATWNEEQSRRNFQIVAAKVVPYNIPNSKLLMHPLLAEGGGDFYHSGGKHWNSFLDSEWQTLANWVCGRKTNEKIVELTGACAGAD